jgi:hypothetical protein
MLNILVGQNVEGVRLKFLNTLIQKNIFQNYKTVH